MKQLVLLFFLTIFCHLVNAQKFQDNFNYKITYKLDFKLDSTSSETRTEYMYLFFGDKLSQFSSRAHTLANPIVRKGNTASTSRAAVTKFFLVTIKNRELNKIFNTLFIPMDQFYYTQNSKLFNWEIEKETRIIEGFKVQKATTSFAGRDYIAWFSPEIPIPDGPYKFNGLPGLILEIADLQNEYVFTFVGLEKLTPSVKFQINFKNYIPSTEEEIQKRFYTYRKDPLTYMRAQGRGKRIEQSPENNKSLVESFTEMLEKENNPIELE